MFVLEIISRESRDGKFPGIAKSLGIPGYREIGPVSRESHYLFLCSRSLTEKHKN